MTYTLKELREFVDSCDELDEDTPIVVSAISGSPATDWVNDIDNIYWEYGDNGTGEISVEIDIQEQNIDYPAANYGFGIQDGSIKL